MLMLFVTENYSANSSFKIGGTLVISFIVIVLISMFRNYKFNGKSMLLSLAGSNVVILTTIPQIINYFFGGKEVVLKEYPLVFIGPIVVMYILTFSWYTGYNKLVKKQKDYYNLINT